MGTIRDNQVIKKAVFQVVETIVYPVDCALPIPDPLEETKKRGGGRKVQKGVEKGRYEGQRRASTMQSLLYCPLVGVFCRLLLPFFLVFSYALPGLL